jgi:RND family efflux transporter MFP subunit
MKLAARRLAISGALILSGCSSHEAPPPPPPVETVVVSAQSADASADSFTGVIRAPIESDLSFQAPGIIAQRLVSRGQIVRRGQVIATLDTSDLASGARSATASLDAARAQAASSRASAAVAAAEEARLRGLDVAGAISKLAYERAAAQAKASNEQARSADERVNAAASDAAIAQRRAGYGVLRAPRDGIITEVLAEPGQVVDIGRPVAKFASGPREADVAVPENALDLIRKAAVATLYGQSVGEIPAVLREVSGATDPVTRTYSARFRLGAGGADAPLGTTVTIRIRRDGRTTGLTIPRSAIVDRGNGPTVFAVDPGSRRVLARRITVTSLTTETAVVSGDLRAGDRIVRTGAFLLKSGQRVGLAANGQR